MKISRLGTALLAVAILISPALAADQAQDVSVTEHVKQVALFQNGYSFFISEIPVKADSSDLTFFPQVPAIKGTFWVAYPKAIDLESLIASESDYFDEYHVSNFAQMLKANIGKKIRVSANEKEYQGTLLTFADEQGKTQEDDGNGIVPPEAVKLFVIQTEKGVIALNPKDVKMLEFETSDVNTVYQGAQKKWQIKAVFDDVTADSKLALSYLGKGLNWYPSYYLNILDDNKAFLSAKAVVVNDACDLDGVVLKFVTGSPVMDVSALSPMTAKLFKDMYQYRNGGAKPQVGRMMMAKAEMAYDEAPDYGQELDAINLGDLYFYPYESVTLKKGETGYYPLFSSELSYESLYVWDVQSVGPVPRIKSSFGGRPKKDGSQPVWYCIKLKNETKMPWTKASVEMVRDGMMLGQTILPETPMKDDAKLTINKAQNIDAQSQEVEVDRNRNAANFHGYQYDLLTVEGTLTVTNYKNETIKLEVNKVIEGKILKSKPDGEQKPVTDGVFRVNPIQKVTWEVELKAGDTKEVTYSYQKYVR